MGGGINVQTWKDLEPLGRWCGTLASGMSGGLAGICMVWLGGTPTPRLQQHSPPHWLRGPDLLPLQRS